ncbi:MAG: hypothetical protein WCH74_01050 [Chloroflexota bacterium]
METLHGMLAKTYDEDRARTYAHPGRQHAAELRRSRPPRESLSRPMLVTAFGRLAGRPRDTVTLPCTTADGRPGRLVARFEGTERRLVCEVG